VNGNREIGTARYRIRENRVCFRKKKKKKRTAAQSEKRHPGAITYNLTVQLEAQRAGAGGGPKKEGKG